MELRDYFLLFIGELRCHEKLPDYLALTIYRSLKKTPYEVHNQIVTIRMGSGDIWCKNILPLLHAGYSTGQEFTVRVSVEVP